MIMWAAKGVWNSSQCNADNPAFLYRESVPMSDQANSLAESKQPQVMFHQ